MSLLFDLAQYARHRPWCPEDKGPVDCTCGLYALLDHIRCTTCGHSVKYHTARDVSDVVGWPCNQCKSARCHGFTDAATPTPTAARREQVEAFRSVLRQAGPDERWSAAALLALLADAPPDPVQDANPHSGITLADLRDWAESQRDAAQDVIASRGLDGVARGKQVMAEELIELLRAATPTPTAGAGPLDVERLARACGLRQYGAYYPPRDDEWATMIAAEYALLTEADR